jgi:hypothetical protein
VYVLALSFIGAPLPRAHKSHRMANSPALGDLFGMSLLD